LNDVGRLREKFVQISIEARILFHFHPFAHERLWLFVNVHVISSLCCGDGWPANQFHLDAAYRELARRAIGISTQNRPIVRHFILSIIMQ
jgi:hypothetical protein